MGDLEKKYKIISLFNNKGGVGKTTYLNHISHLIAREKNVLMVDCDSQCNLTAYNLDDAKIQKAWSPQGNSIHRILEDVIGGIGDYRRRQAVPINPKLWLVPGDLDLNKFEDELATTWITALGEVDRALRLQTAIFRYIDFLANKNSIDIVFLDLGPNLGALNRSLLISSDYFIVPVSPDLFSIRATENLGKRLVAWSRDWQERKKTSLPSIGLLPTGFPTFLGYVVQQYNSRNTKATRGWQIFLDRLPLEIKHNIVDTLSSMKQVHMPNRSNYEIGKIPNLNSLIPYSMEALKPVYECTKDDGLTGEHITKARESVKYYQETAQLICNL